MDALLLWFALQETHDIVVTSPDFAQHIQLRADLMRFPQPGEVDAGWSLAAAHLRWLQEMREYAPDLYRRHDGYIEQQKWIVEAYRLLGVAHQYGGDLDGWWFTSAEEALSQLRSLLGDDDYRAG